MDTLPFQMLQVERLAAAAAEVLELSRRAADVADGVRAQVPQVAGAFDHDVWRGPAAQSAAARAGDRAASVSRAAAQLDQFAADLARHGRTAANRAEVLRMALAAIEEHHAQQERTPICTPALYNPLYPDAPAPNGYGPQYNPFLGLVDAQEQSQAGRTGAQHGASGS